jgi:hypothetical protein
MELVVFIAALIVLAALASHFGVDSRDSFRSHESEFAARGFTREQLVLPRRDPRAL